MKNYDKFMKNGVIFLPGGGPGASWTAFGVKMAPGMKIDAPCGGPGHPLSGQKDPNGGQMAPKMEPKLVKSRKKTEEKKRILFR